MQRIEALKRVLFLKSLPPATLAEIAGLGRERTLSPGEMLFAEKDCCLGLLVVLEGAVTVRHVARQFDDDQNSRRLAPATTADAYLSLPITGALSLEGRAENVFDERVEAGITGADIVERATPRTWWIGLRYRPAR